MKQENKYSTKLKNPLWQKRRLEIMEKARFECEVCHDPERTLNVHHLFYVAGRQPWEYPDAVLVCLCEECHEKEHREQTLIHEVEDVMATFMVRSHPENDQLPQLLLELRKNPSVKDRFSWLIAHLMDAQQKLCEGDQA